VKELVFVKSGRGRLVVEGKEETLGSQDSALILPNQRYYWEGKLKLVTVCTPAWYPEQHRREGA
jgi:mannose-6-phosphate isomerase-like protein (cupin superfamily)